MNTSNKCLAQAAQSADEFLDEELRFLAIELETAIPEDINVLLDGLSDDMRMEKTVEYIDAIRLHLFHTKDDPRLSLETFPLRGQFSSQTPWSRFFSTLMEAEANLLVKERLKATEKLWALPLIANWCLASLNALIYRNVSITKEDRFAQQLLLALNKCLLNLHTLPERLKLALNYLSQHTQELGNHVKMETHHLTNEVIDTDQSIADLIRSPDSVLYSDRISFPCGMYKRMIEQHSTAMFSAREIINGIAVAVFSQPILLTSTAVHAYCNFYNDCDEIHLEASVKLFVDCDFRNENFHHRNIVIVAPEVDIWKTKRAINVSGQANIKHSTKPSTPDVDGSVNGPDGVDADHGLPGESGGHVTIICGKLLNGDYLSIISNGGDGSNGADGGDGAPGSDGSDGSDGTPPVAVPAYGWDKPVSKLLDFILLGRGEEGELGKRGGNGGRRSVGGEGGYPGNAQVFLIDSEHSPELNQLTNVGISLEANRGDEGEFMIYYNKCMLKN